MPSSRGTNDLPPLFVLFPESLYLFLCHESIWMLLLSFLRIELGVLRIGFNVGMEAAIKTKFVSNLNQISKW